MGSAVVALGDAALETLGTPAAAAEGKLPRSTPEALGIDPGGILAFLDAVDEKVGGLHSFMLLRKGQVAAEGWWTPYAPNEPHMLYSLSKSFTSTAVGLAVEQGLLTVDAPITSFFPDDLPAKIDDNLAAMKVRHLLSMGTGHEKDATGPTTQAKDGNWVKAFLALPVEHAPGSRFVYNSAATYMCSAIVQKLTGKTVLEYLTPRLFEPIGIQGATWESCPRGINVGGWGLNITTEDIARFGQLYLQNGKWHAKQLVPSAWIAEATTKQISNGTDPQSDWAQGYGYQFWRCRHGAFRGDGAFGQYCVVMPEQEAVLAITSGVKDMQAVLNLTWDHLLPAMKSASGAAAGKSKLEQRLSALTVPAPSGDATSPTAKRVSGKTYRFEANEEKFESVTPSFEGGRCTITLRNAQGEHKLVAGAEKWVKGTAPMNDNNDAKVAARGTWIDADTYEMNLCFYRTPYIDTITWKFTGDDVTVTRKRNVGFGPTDRPNLIGHST